MVGSAALLCMLFVLSGTLSTSVSQPQSINCGAINLNFSASTGTSLTVPLGSSNVPFMSVHATNTGNVTYTLGLNVVPVNSSAPFTIRSANPIPQSPGQFNYTSFGVYSPTKAGTYPVVANVTAKYGSCPILSKTFRIDINVVNNSTNSSA